MSLDDPINDDNGSLNSAAKDTAQRELSCKVNKIRQSARFLRDLRPLNKSNYRHRNDFYSICDSASRKAVQYA